MFILDYIDALLSKGVFCFRGAEASDALGSGVIATRADLRRLRHKGEVAIPYRGFYVIVPPEYRKMGCLPANQFIPLLMDHRNSPCVSGEQELRTKALNLRIRFNQKNRYILNSIPEKDVTARHHGITLPDLQTTHSGLNRGGVGFFFFSGEPGTDNSA